MDAATLRAAMLGHLGANEQRTAALADARYAALAPIFTAAMLAAGCTNTNRAAMWCAQLGHETSGLRYQNEIASGSAYEDRKDLGNTQAGDGPRFKGHGWIQVTGRGNHAAVSKWAHDHGLAPTPTYFVDHPAELGSDTYTGLGAVWYWTVARPKINSQCDATDLEAVTRAINGGTNGLDDRRRRWNNCRALGARLLPATAVTDTSARRRRALLLTD